MRMFRAWLLVMIGVVLVACAGQAPQPTLSTETDAVAVEDSVAASRPQLVVMTHDSFAISEEVIVAFEQAHRPAPHQVYAGNHQHLSILAGCYTRGRCPKAGRWVGGLWPVR